MRDRIIRATTWLSRGFSRLDPRVALTYAGLWNYCDDHGRGYADPNMVWAALYAVRSIEAQGDKNIDISVIEVGEHLRRLREGNQICTYLGCDGKVYLHCIDWHQHQNPKYVTKSKLPPCREHEPVAECWLHRRQDDLVLSCSSRRTTGLGDPVDTDGLYQADPAGLVEVGETSPNLVQLSPETYSGPIGKPDTAGQAGTPSGNLGQVLEIVPREERRGEESNDGADEPRPRRRASSAPATFEITDPLREWARSRGVTVDLEAATEEFLNYHRGKGSLQRDWTATWRTWMLRTIRYGGPQARVADQPYRGWDV